MSPRFGPRAHTVTTAHHVYPHPDTREAGHFDLWSLTLLGIVGGEVAPTSLRQWWSPSMPSAPVGDSHPLVSHGDPSFLPSRTLAFG